MARSPAGVAQKLGNFGAFDPELKRKNISGLGHGSKLDREIWDEFHNDWGKLVAAADRLRIKLSGSEKSVGEFQLQTPAGPSERVATVRQRVHQAFFRDAVLSSYEETCCVTGICVVECLVAGHIVPWSVDEKLRADPTNGLCLTATFEKLFDRGLMTIEADLTVKVSQQVLKDKNEAVRKLIAVHHQRAIRRPARFLPRERHLKWHRENIFVP